MVPSTTASWATIRRYHKLLILSSMVLLWTTIAISAIYLFLSTSSDPTRSGWTPARAAGTGPVSLGEATGVAAADLALPSATSSSEISREARLMELLESLDGGGASQLSSSQREALERRLSSALLALERADHPYDVATPDGRGDGAAEAGGEAGEGEEGDMSVGGQGEGEGEGEARPAEGLGMPGAAEGEG
ncbi:hypothetical protein EMIHUDRAFT_431977 [Emiliania huxleyi CCMP1516]|uniref:Uncharacterized protein n=2 Tax=Emiliania huxleyi TaxID=2903 RepID=A0A0D3L2E1_EMIH1|nr:hypothetical protein EMIHUDRAFT_431977 [Emiliania huxleyi CCMP1516]EOD42176.1 hypothetical protein EMIHUDRAFT_431977 [Emiliania huxleyi CCMP1516]|eukprot:XP_005794605.1 hypothetical protein EMIHUDRAFT_431977 [Emiliania huxleyi CCMP1516]